MRYRLPLLYKKLLILSLVFGPIIWLMFTPDGQRRTDTVVLWLFGETEIKLDFKALTSQYSEQDLRKVYPKLNWQCESRQQAYGERYCVSQIGIFNGIPARYITTYYRLGQLSAVKLHYRAEHHGFLQSQLGYQLGKPEEPADVSQSALKHAQVLQWRTPHGMVIMKRLLRVEQEPALFWLSSDLLVQ